MIGSLTFRTDRMRRAAGENFATETDLADYLVKKGLAFRQAHGVVGKIVRFCEAEGKALDGLSLVELRRFSPLFQDDAKDALTVEASLRARAATGGTAPEAVRRSLALARTLLARA
jgi:argininosuccinate lyase